MGFFFCPLKVMLYVIPVSLVWRTGNGSAFSIKYFAVLTRAGGEALAL